MSVQTLVPNCSRGDVFELVRVVSACLGVEVALGEAKVNGIENMRFLTRTHQEVLRFDITMNEFLLMHVFDAIDKVNGEHAHSLICEVTVTKDEQVVQRRPQHLYHHYIEVPLTSIMIDVAKTDYY